MTTLATPQLDIERASRPALGARSAPLDLHEGIGTVGCSRWPDKFRLLASDGQLVAGRCKATNLCDYCARLAAVENAEVLAQAALAGRAPQLWSVLTTRSTSASMADFKLARRKVTDHVKHRFPDSERATLVEFTTGYAGRPAGRRRPHWNDLWLGIDPSDRDELRALVTWAWCKRVDARPAGQYVGTVADTGGLMRYLALHFQKESQQPPKGWRSHRFTTTRGYLGRPMAEAREEARKALRLRRELWRAERNGLTGAAALTAAQAAVDYAASLDWTLINWERTVRLGAPVAGTTGGFITPKEHA